MSYFCGKQCIENVDDSGFARDLHVSVMNSYYNFLRLNCIEYRAKCISSELTHLVAGYSLPYNKQTTPAFGIAQAIQGGRRRDVIIFSFIKHAY